MGRAMCSSRTGSGTEPMARMVSWKAALIERRAELLLGLAAMPRVQLARLVGERLKMVERQRGC
jgi:hypothetical protein